MSQPTDKEPPEHAPPSCGFGPTRLLPAPVLDAPLSPEAGSAIAVFAGGCFWGVQAVFQHVVGVHNVLCGYSGGSAAMANYEAVCSGASGHAEAVQIAYDPAQVSYGRLLMLFFAVAHDPTQLNRQGPDIGSQYRSAIFTGNEEQRHIARAYIEQLDKSGALPRPVATELVQLEHFYVAEPYHQNYAMQHPYNPYVATHDLPKISQLLALYPAHFQTHQP